MLTVQVVMMIMIITVYLFLQVKKAVGGSARGMALYEDDVRPSCESHITVHWILYNMTFLLYTRQFKYNLKNSIKAEQQIGSHLCKCYIS